MGILDTILSGLIGSKNQKDVKELYKYAQMANAAWEPFPSLSHDALRQKSVALKARIKESLQKHEELISEFRKKTEDPQLSDEEKESLFDAIDKEEKKLLETLQLALDEAMPEAFAIMKETARRFKENQVIEVTANAFDEEVALEKGYIKVANGTAYWPNSWKAAGGDVVWDMVHYDVQLIGGAVLHLGKIAEMATGEGKTLVATLPIFLNALSGRGVHIVTVNDYLARRDSEWMGPIFEFHGLRVDCIDKHQPNSDARRKAYRADVVYGTNNEFGFDYLRDNMATHPDQLVQRIHQFAIIDEVDSVLIDEARTPLIISGPTPKGDHQEFIQLRPLVEKLVTAQRKLLNTQLTEAKKILSREDASKEENKKGSEMLLRTYRGLPKNSALIKFLSEPGIRAILQKTENHFMQDQSKEMHKIDDELFFAIEEKTNAVDLTEKGINLISQGIDDDNFFLLPDIATELAEIDVKYTNPEERNKFKDALLRDFSVKSERIHTIQQLLKAYALFDRDKDYVVMDGKVKIVDEQTGRILDGRRYSDGLHQAIEAKENVKVEAATQTYATVTLQNYFRMYHKLAGMTGTAETEAKEFWDIYKLEVVVIPTNRPIQRKDMEDLVFKTKREKYNAVIDKTVEFVEAKRPVLVGTTSVEISELLSRMLKLRNIKHQVLNAKLHQKEAEIVAEAGKAGTVTIATNMAGRGTDIKLGPGVKDAGGLAIIGTERHDSRRVDRQLRGRSGRQGDPGSSVFFVSLEDDLMRIFGSERIAKLMDRMGIKEGEVITHRMITRSIERAQKKVEENNFGMRKRLLEYDDVMNLQREAVYRKRRNSLFGERVSLDISNTMYDVCEQLVESFHEARDYPGFSLEVYRQLSMEPPINEAEFIKANTQEVVQSLHEAVLTSLQQRMDSIRTVVWPVIEKVFLEQGEQYQNIMIPLSDGMKTMQIQVPLKMAYQNQGVEVIRYLQKSIVLALIDFHWKDHLREMDDLKSSVSHASYEQKDPLLVYKQEAFTMFQQFLAKLNQETLAFLMKADLPKENPKSQRPTAPIPSKPLPPLPQGLASKPAPQGGSPRLPEQDLPDISASATAVASPAKAEEKIGRNDPCPCGSGKKYKNCHGG